MIKKVIAIGDSFLAGSELKNPNTTWPALFADKYNLEYQCLARPGHSIQFVIRTLCEAIHTESQNCLFVIHWPNALRMEYIDKQHDNWIQINPNAILFGNEYSADVQTIYYKHINSLLGDKWHSLAMISMALQMLKQTNHQYAMTTVDDFLFATDFHNPPYIEFLQDKCQEEIYWFNNLTFLKWAEVNSFAFGPHGHPLEQAHQKAFEYFEPVYKKLIDLQ
jgi:hypothetical protein